MSNVNFRAKTSAFCQDFAKFIREVASLAVLSGGFTALNDIQPSDAARTMAFLCTVAMAMLVADWFFLSGAAKERFPASRPVSNFIVGAIILGGMGWASWHWMEMATNAAAFVAQSRDVQIVEVKIYGPPLNATPVREVQGTRI